MSDLLSMLLAFVAGIALGTMFFGGLWLTVRKALVAKLPALWVLSSFVLRMGLTLAGLYYIGADNWQRLVVGLLGFMVARFVVTHYTKTWDVPQIRLKKEETYGA